ncbi:general substrate transporter [Gonapodya prolifera JEL478]|uniref:General substrate transporter n=1 Tax=Gonapodya prolifera (strain JEL478) TaxID=1344416 RepID=A0A139ANJ4_GONPJ|nr:general substrate transporter [Gonapodya prolifera JEL478]|eukprot:KXS18310.1 general substrate transporter [Gonapodya prolifera JEL478]
MQGYALFIALTAAIGGLLFGYEVGIINQVLLMDSFRLFFGLSTVSNGGLVNSPNSADLEGNIVSLFLAGCIPGAFLVSYSADFLGRKASVAVGTLAFLVGGILQTAATGIPLLYAGRCIGGLGVGLLSGTVPLYISECAPTSIRGRIGTMQQLMITIGIMLANIINAILTSVIANDENRLWRLAMGIQLIPAVILLGLFFILPESPRFLISRGKVDEASAIVARLNGESKDGQVVQTLVTEIQESIAIEKRLPKASWLDMCRMPIRPRSIAAFGVFFFQQWSGINAVMYYSSSLFLGMGLSKDIATKVATTVQSVINVLATFPAVYFIERLGRRTLLYIGAVGSSIFMWLLVLWVGLFNGTQILDPNTGTLIPDPNSGPGKAYGILGVISMYMYIVFFAATWGPVGWVYISEIFPLRARGKGASIGSMSHWINNFIIAKAWPYAAVGLGAWQYTIFAGCSMVSLLFVRFFVPETRGKSLEEMDEVFGGAPGSGLTDEEKQVLAEIRADPSRANLLGTTGGH